MTTTATERYYREELRYLRDLGRELALARPETARFLAAPGADPDVERLLEGTAFLTAGLRQRLDQDCPELIADALDALWPQHLLPVPSMAILRADPPPRALEPVDLPRGALVESAPIDGTRCRFATAWPARVTGLALAGAEWIVGGALALHFTCPRGADARALAGPALRLHLAGDAAEARWLRWRLLAHRQAIVVRRGEIARALPADALRSVGFAESEALLPSPTPVPRRLRLLHEYSIFPEKFQFVDLVGLDRVDLLAGAESFEVIIDLARDGAAPPSSPRLLTNCVPLVNLFATEGDPLRLGERAEAVIRPVGDPRHHEVFSVEQVIGISAGASARRRYVATQRRAPGEGGLPAYRLLRWHRVDGDGTEVALSAEPDETSDEEVLSLELLCTNRRLALRLGPGDLRIPGVGMQPTLRLANLGQPTSPLPPSPTSELAARLARHLALGDVAADLAALRSLLALGDARGALPPLAIAAVESAPLTRLRDGVPVRGRETRVRLADGAFADPAELHFFGDVLDHALASASALNRFTRLRLDDARGIERCAFPARIGGTELR
jgi:type VI secretion system protein ImpG